MNELLEKNNCLTITDTPQSIIDIYSINPALCKQLIIDCLIDKQEDIEDLADVIKTRGQKEILLSKYLQ